MKNFIRNIKEHKIAALVCFGSLAVIIVITIIVMRGGARKNSEDASSSLSSDEEVSDTSEYFTDTDYPVRVTKDGEKIIIELDGSKAPDSQWIMTYDDPSKEVVTIPLNEGEKDGILRTVVEPKAIGYAALTFTRSGKIGELAYDAVIIEADVYVSEQDDEMLSVTLSDIRQSAPSVGALDSETPYLIEGNRIVFPNGGDWTLTPELKDNAPTGLFYIEAGYDGETLQYFYVEKDLSALTALYGEQALKVLSESRLVLKSEKLGIEQKFECLMNDDKLWELYPYNEDQAPSSGTDDSSSKSTSGKEGSEEQAE